MKFSFPLFRCFLFTLILVMCRISAEAQNVPPPLPRATPTPRSTTTTRLFPTLSPTPAPTPTPLPAPPMSQAYLTPTPRILIVQGNTMVPLSMLSNGLGASTGQVQGKRWRILFFDKQIDVFQGQRGAIFGGAQVTLPVAPQLRAQHLYVPWKPIAEYLGITWRVLSKGNGAAPTLAAPTMLVQYPAAYITDIRHSNEPSRTRLVLSLSSRTRITATQDKQSVRFNFAAARMPNVPSLEKVNDYLVSHAKIESGNWRASLSMKLNYAAPVRWFTVANPPRLVVDIQRLFEEKNDDAIRGGLTLTKIRRGTARGPLSMYVVRVNPREGWRIRLATGGYSVLQRARPSRIASRRQALVAVNGGFFAYDGAAVGALLINGEWLRPPWKGRTALGFKPNGAAHIGNLQAITKASFSNGLVLPARDLNGWPDAGTISAMTRRLGTRYTLRAGEMAVVVKDGVVVSMPGSGVVPIHENGFTLVANGKGATEVLSGVQRGLRATLSTQAIGWEGYTDIIGAGPRLVKNGRIEVTALQENFRSDVRVGPGPRTAFGLDKYGRYIICVVDGRQPYHSVGLTLHEMAATMIQLGAVNAINLDGGGSSAMTVKNRVINSPSDGSERSVSNALLVAR